MTSHTTRAAGIATLLLVSPALAQSAPNFNALGECRLNGADTMATLGKLPVIATSDESDDMADVISKRYNPAQIKPFGINVSEFSDQYYADETGASIYYTSVLTVNYDQAKSTILRSLGLSACKTEGQNYSKTRTCIVNTGGGGYPRRTLAESRSGTSTLNCAF